MSWVTPKGGTSGGASSVTTSVQVLTLANDATLTGERRLVIAEGLGATDGGAGGNYSLAMTSRTLEASGASLTTSTTVTLEILNYVVAPNVLGTNKTIRLLVGGWWRGASPAATLSGTLGVQLGATVMFADLVPLLAQTTPVSAAWFMDIKLTAENATNAQVVSGKITFGLGSLGATTGMGDLGSDEVNSNAAIFGSAAEDSTASLTFSVKFGTSGAFGSQTVVKKFHVLRLI